MAVNIRLEGEALTVHFKRMLKCQPDAELGVCFALDVFLGPLSFREVSELAMGPLTIIRVLG